MFNILEQLEVDLISYRDAFTHRPSQLASASEVRHYFHDVLIQTSKLYLDMLLIERDEDLLAAKLRDTSLFPLPSDGLERVTRDEFQLSLRSWAAWAHFQPEHAFSAQLRLTTLQEYFDSFTLHLPEIFAETANAEARLHSVFNDQSAAAFTDLLIRIQHVGRNHISFVQHSLQYAADESCWSDT